MKKFLYILIIAFLLISCGKKKPVYSEDTTQINVSESVDTLVVDTVCEKKEVVATSQAPAKTTNPSHTRYKPKDNMHGFDPASEDDSDDNGMTRYMEVNDDEGWD